MSMLFSLRRVSQEKANELKKEPGEILFFLFGQDASISVKRTIFRELIKKKPDTKRHWLPPQEDHLLHLGKYWHILHYVLSGCPWEGPLPQSTLLVGGTSIGDISVGYGPARVLGKQEIFSFYSFLLALDKDNFGSNISEEDIVKHEIYYEAWSAEDRNVLWHYVEKLMAFLSDALADREEIIMYLY